MGESDCVGNGFVLMGRAMLSISLIQFSIDGWGCVPSLLFDLRPNYGKGKEDNGNLLQITPHSVPLTLQQATADPRLCWTLLGKSGSVSCVVIAPSYWVLVHRFQFVPSKSLFPSPV